MTALVAVVCTSAFVSVLEALCRLSAAQLRRQARLRGALERAA